jgi:Carboxypeptidase regulatory-like domain
MTRKIMMGLTTRRTSGCCLSILGLAFLMLIPTGLRAQVGSAALSGVVQDATGAVVPGATATLTNQVTGAQRIATTNGDGIFAFSAIPSGDYNLNVTANNFKGYAQTGIHLDPGDNKSIPEIKLALGSAVETVTVEQSESSLPLDSGQLSSTISASDLERLSIVGRDATELQRTLPGFAIRNLGSTNQAPDFS